MNKQDRLKRDAVKDVLKRLLKDADRSCTFAYDSGRLEIPDLSKVDKLMEEVGRDYGLHITWGFGTKKDPGLRYKVVNEKA